MDNIVHIGKSAEKEEDKERMLHLVELLKEEIEEGVVQSLMIVGTTGDHVNARLAMSIAQEDVLEMLGLLQIAGDHIKIDS